MMPFFAPVFCVAQRVVVVAKRRAGLTQRLWEIVEEVRSKGYPDMRNTPTPLILSTFLMFVPSLSW